MPDRPTPGQLETRSEPLAVDGQRIRGVIPYGSESRDLGGWREVIEPTALRSARLDDLVATVDHAGVPIGRYPTTLSIEDRSDGLHWSVDPPQSRADVREAVERGDLRSGSWRMLVAKDRWAGDVRHIEQIAELRDVAVVTNPAYQGAAVELRNHTDPATGQEDNMADTAEKTNSTTTQTPQDPPAAPPAPEPTPPPAAAVVGGLNVEERTSAPAPRGLADEFRAAGFPGETATIPWQAFEDRAVTWTGSVDNISKAQAVAGPLGADQRYAWPAFQRVQVDAAATAVDVFTQTARTLATAANVVRAIDAVTAKPETASALTIITTSLKQLASIYTNVPNIQLEQPAFNTVIENDLTLAINDGLDKLVLDYIATAGFQAPSTDPLLVSIRKCMTTIMAAGYNPDTVILTPPAAEALDVLVSGIASGVNDYVFPPAQLAPNNIFGLNKRISKTIPATAVVDSQALGKLYVSPVTLGRFEADAGTTNRGNVRMESPRARGGEP
jgi:Escherichia/Staphylococcus phage prohead protease